MGRNFEILVKLLEERLGPSGITVTSPDYIRGKKSSDVQEIDISLKGKMGTSDALGIIECREHKKPQGLQWIQQIESKRDDVGAHMAMAVSSSGFTEPAVKYALSVGIKLRTLEKVDPVELVQWFQLQEVTQYIQNALFKNVLLHLAHPNPSSLRFPSFVRKAIKKEHFDADAPIFRRKLDGTKASWNDIWKSCPIDKLFADFPKDGTRVSRQIEISMINRSDCFQIITTTKPVDLVSADVDAELWIEVKKYPLTALRQYRSNDKILSQSAEFDIELSGQKFAIELHRNHETGLQFGSVRKLADEADSKK